GPGSSDGPEAGSLHDVPSLRPGAARRAEGAVRAVLAGAGGEPLVEDLPGGGGEQVADPLPLQRLLRLHLGQGLPAVPAGGTLAQVDQFRAARLGPHPVDDLVDGALAHGELVDGQLGVAFHLLGGGRLLAGLEVDDVRAPVAVGLDAVHLAADADLVVAGFQGDVEVVLAGHRGAAGAVHDVPAEEAFQCGARVL